MTIGCVIFYTKNLNNKIGMGLMSDKHSPNTLITGQPPLKYTELVSLTFGEYVEVLYTANNVLNNTEECTTSTISLYISENLQPGRHQC